MTTQQPITTIVVGNLADQPVADVLEVVRDWTATDLLDRSVWLDVDQSGGETVLQVVDREGTQRHPAEEWLAMSGIVRTRVVLLQVFPDGAAHSPMPVADRARALLEEIGLGGRPLVNLLVPASATTRIPSTAAVESRPNVLLQARDGQSPGALSRPVRPDELAEHAAAGLAVVAGLWAPMAEAPFDENPAWPGTQVVVARAYARTLDSRQVLSGLSEQVYRAEGTLPRPRTQRGDRLTDVPDGQTLPTAETAAQSLLAVHDKLTHFQAPPPYVPRRPTAVGLLTAIRMFLSFFGAAVRNAPRAWVDGVVRRTARVLSTTTTSALFGRNASYEVVVLGVRPSSTAGDDEEDDVSALIDSAHRLAREVSPGTEFTTTDTNAFWTDVATVASSLADGSDVPAQVRMPMLGDTRQIVDRPESIVPPSNAESHGLPVGVLPEIGGLRVDFDDPYLALQADRLLQEERQRVGVGPEDVSRSQVLDTARNGLQSWAGQQRSFTWTVGITIAQELDKARRVLADAVRAEATAAASTPPRDVLDAQRRSRGFVLGALAVAVLAIAVVVGLVVGDVLSLLVGSCVALGVAVVWLVSSTLVFLRHQKALFAWLHVRDENHRHREWARSTAVHVAGEVQRLGVLYRQSRLWTRVLSAVVHDPFGVAGSSDEVSAYPAGLSGSLPLSTAVGAAGFTPEGQSDLVHEARRARLGIGWLNAQLGSRIEAALAARSQRYGRQEHQAVWRDSGYSSQGPLRELVATLGTVEERRRAAAGADAGLVRWLTELGDVRGLDWSLAAVHPEVTVSAGASIGTISGQSFLSPVLDHVEQLDPHGFSAIGSAQLSNQVDRTDLAALGVPVPPGSAVRTAVLPRDGQQSMDRFVARLDTTRQLTLDHVSHFTPDEPVVVPSPRPQRGITVEA
ncbi:hypothetical protein [Geodermatophilus sp. URMC 64]